MFELAGVIILVILGLALWPLVAAVALLVLVVVVIGFAVWMVVLGQDAKKHALDESVVLVHIQHDTEHCPTRQLRVTIFNGSNRRLQAVSIPGHSTDWTANVF